MYVQPTAVFVHTGGSALAAVYPNVMAIVSILIISSFPDSLLGFPSRAKFPSGCLVLVESGGEVITVHRGANCTAMYRRKCFPARCSNRTEIAALGEFQGAPRSCTLNFSLSTEKNIVHRRLCLVIYFFS